MPLSRLNLTNFRCFPTLSLDLPRQLVLIGPNGRGKSSILEAISLLALTRSLRARSDIELVRSGESTAVVEGSLGPRKLLRVVVEAQGQRVVKRASRFGRAVPLTELVGSLRTVLFSPEDSELCTGAPRLRRRLLDGLLIQRDGSAYATVLQNLFRTLKQRNALLASAVSLPALRSAIGVWDLMLGEETRSITEKRRALVLLLQQQVTTALESMTVPLKVTLSYRSTTADLDRIDELLAARLERDQSLGATTIGPHRDELEMTANGRPLSVASRGEQRAVLVALKLAEYELLRQATGEEPIFLVDDVFSELDPTRRAQVATHLAERPCIVTSADPTSLPSELSSVPRHEL